MSAAEPRDALIGRRVANYEILERLGAGGMGVVYKAVDLKLERAVALKFLPPQFETGRAKERFFQEARAASSLDHANIGVIHGIEETPDGQLFIVMACYEGETLFARIRRGPLPLRQALDIAAQTAEGLAEAHAHGIVHRDVKPSNIIVTRQGVVKLLDFGLAKLAGDVSFTRTGTAVGTAAYMSPEQAMGHAVDHRTDIWSLGVVLYEMIAGRLPFEGDSAPVVLLAITTQPPRPMPEVPPAVKAIVHRCLAKDPAVRYQQAAETLEDLRRMDLSPAGVTRTLDIDALEVRRQAGEPASAPPAPRPRRRFRTLLVAGAALALALLAAWFLPARWRGEPTLPREKHVVVLPFANIGGELANAAICEGLMETLTSRLTSLEGFGGSLWVAPADEVRRRGIADAATARRTFGANLVVTGSVQRFSRHVRLTVNLVDARTIRQLGSAVVDDPAGDFSTLQDEAVARLARLLEVRLSRGTLGRAAGQARAAPAAYESYLKGLGFLQRYDKSGNVDTAIDLFEGAISRDPRFALGYAKLAEAQWLKSVLNKDARIVDIALANARRASEIDDQLAPVHVTLGRIHAGMGKNDLAVEEFRRALKLDERNAEAHQQVARAYESMGRAADAENSLQRAIALRPDYWEGYNSLGAFYARQGRYGEAAAQFRRVLEITPDNASAYSNFGVVLSNLGDLAAARQAYEKSLALSPTYSTYSNLAGIYYSEGRYLQAAAMYRKAIDMNERDYVPWAGMAAAREGAGDLARSREAFERAVAIAADEAARRPNDPVILRHVAFYSAKLGRREEALRRIHSALALAPNDNRVLYQAALVYETLGERTRALEYLRAARDRGYPAERIARDPDLRKLREDPAFRALRK